VRSAGDTCQTAEAVVGFQRYPQGRLVALAASVENTKPADPTSAGFSFRDLRMSEAMKLIVDGYYIRLMKDRKALEALREHWRQLRGSLEERSNGWLDVRRPIRQFDKDILAIEQGSASAG